MTDGKDKVSVQAFAREGETKKGMDESQITGASSSYARKYAFNGLFCIDDVKDADGVNGHTNGESRPNSAHLNGIQEPEAKTPVEKVKEKVNGKPSESLECVCGKVISKKVHDFSMDKYGQPLCFDCQKGVK